MTGAEILIALRETGFDKADLGQLTGDDIAGAVRHVRAQREASRDKRADIERGLVALSKAGLLAGGAGTDSPKDT